MGQGLLFKNALLSKSKLFGNSSGKYDVGDSISMSSLGFIANSPQFLPLNQYAFINGRIIGMSSNYIYYIIKNTYIVYRINRNTRVQDGSFSITLDSTDIPMLALEDVAGNIYIMGGTYVYKYNSSKVRQWKTATYNVTSVNYSGDIFILDNILYVYYNANSNGLCMNGFNIDTGVRTVGQSNLITLGSNYTWGAKNSNYYYFLDWSTNIVKKYDIRTGVFVKNMFSGDTTPRPYRIFLVSDDEVFYMYSSTGTFTKRKEGSTADYQVSTGIVTPYGVGFDPVKMVVYLLDQQNVRKFDLTVGALLYALSGYRYAIYPSVYDCRMYYDSAIGALIGDFYGYPVLYNQVNTSLGVLADNLLIKS